MVFIQRNQAQIPPKSRLKHNNRQCLFKSCAKAEVLIRSVNLQVEETEEARKKLSNAKSISSAQFFGDQNKSAESEAKASLQKFTVRAFQFLFDFG